MPEQARAPVPPSRHPGPSGRDKLFQKFADDDVKNPPIKGGILFAGSSSIEKWKSVPVDFKPLLVLNRGVGGSMISDWLKFAPKIVLPYEPKTIVFYCGDTISARSRPVSCPPKCCRISKTS